MIGDNYEAARVRWSPLHEAAQDNSVSTIAALVDSGAPIDMRDREGRTPLMVAAEVGNTSAVQLLLQLGAGIEARDDDDATPLWWAAAGKNGRQAAEVLLQHGADVSAANARRWTPLHAAARMGRTGTVLLLLDKGADPGAVEDKGRRAEDLARSEGHYAAAELLRDRQNSARPRSGRTT